MKIDLNTYIINKPFVQKWHQENGKDVSSTLSIIATSSHCPLIALGFYISESIGWTEELKSIVEGYIKYYGYTKILGQPKDSPFLHLDDITKI